MLAVTEVKISNVMGAREVGIEPGEVTVISGKNASGKTSVLEAIKNAIGGGKLAKLATVDSDDEPELVIVLDGDEGHFRIEKKGEKMRVRERVGDTAAFQDVPKPQFWLNGLYDGQMSNPIDFLNAKDKERVLLLLAALPLDYERKDLFEQIGIEPAAHTFEIPEGIHPLQEVALIRSALFSERTGVNGSCRSKEAASEETLLNVPAEIPDDLPDKIHALANDIQADATRIEVEIKGVKAEHDNLRDTRAAETNFKIDGISSEYKLWASKLRAEVEKKIRDAQLGVIEQHKALRESNDDFCAELASDCDSKTDELNEQKDEILERRAELAAMREQQKAVESALTHKKMAEKFATEAASLRFESEALTEALKKLDAYRRGLADDLPIRGLEIEGKEIKLDGIPWGQLNTAKRIEIAVKVACLRAKSQTMPIVWVDGAEALDSDNFGLLCGELKKQDVQAFIGRVSDGDFEVDSNR